MNNNISTRHIDRNRPTSSELPPIDSRKVWTAVGIVAAGSALVAAALVYEPLDTTDKQEVIGVSCAAGFDALRVDVVDTPSNSGDDSDLIFRVACSGGGILLSHDERIQYEKADAYSQSQYAANIYVQSKDTHGEYEDGEGIRHWASEQAVEIKSLLPGTAEVTITNADNIGAFYFVNPATGSTQDLGQ